MQYTGIVELPPAGFTALTSLHLPHTMALTNADADRLLGLPRVAELGVRRSAVLDAVLQRLQQAPGLHLVYYTH